MELYPDIIAGLNGAIMRKLIFSLVLLALSSTIVSAQQYDLVLEDGRVLDPETGVDAVRNVGIRHGKIIRISSEALSGRRNIHASGWWSLNDLGRLLVLRWTAPDT
jgi:hypothetical protein